MTIAKVKPFDGVGIAVNGRSCSHEQLWSLLWRSSRDWMGYTDSRRLRQIDRQLAPAPIEWSAEMECEEASLQAPQSGFCLCMMQSVWHTTRQRNAYHRALGASYVALRSGGRRPENQAGAHRQNPKKPELRQTNSFERKV